MSPQAYRKRLLQLLYQEQARGPLEALECEDLARRLDLSWERIRPEVIYLEKKGYVIVDRPQRERRVYCKVYLTYKGIDWIERNLSGAIPFKLQLCLRNQTEFEVSALETPMGEPHFVARLPYSIDELAAVLKALRLPIYEAHRFTPEQRSFLESQGLINGSSFNSGLLTLIGRTLYETLMVGDVSTAFQMALNQARTARSTVSVQLRFDEDSAEIARYPWELLHFRRPLLPSRAIELTRYISYPEAVTALPTTRTFQLLFIKPRPTDLPKLPSEGELRTVQQALESMADEDTLTVHMLVNPTYESLLNYIESNEVHILHFDGHGTFARQCSDCKAMHYPHMTKCANCGRELTDTQPQGYLAFETALRTVKWISSETLSAVLYNRGLALIVLSACWSSGIAGETLFGGTAPALIQAGVPAVVAMQLPISVDGAVRFMEGFYQALAGTRSIPTAVNAGRIRIYDTNEWFIPTLYLRCQDDDGNLFAE